MKDNNKIPQDLYNALYIRYADTVLCFSDDPELLLLKRKQFWDSIQAVYGKEIYYRKLYQVLWYKFKKQQRSKEIDQESELHIRMMGFKSIVLGDRVVAGRCHTKFAPGRVLTTLSSESERRKKKQIHYTSSVRLIRKIQQS